MNMETSHLTTVLDGTVFSKPGLLTDDDRRALAEITTVPRSVKASVDLASEGVRTNIIYLVTQGWACRYKTTRDGARQIVGFILPGDLCNLDTFMLDQLNYGVRPLAASTVIGLSRERVRALAADRPGIGQAFTWLAIVENAILSQWALTLGRLSARERLAHFLCEMSARLGGDHENTASFELPITQEQVADALGLTAVHVNRTMQQLRAERLITANGRKITVPDRAALCRVAEFDKSYLHGTFA